ncbi:hypothetical protein DFO77_11171 [Marinilabilia salmonicolor]|jgi:hypothetical protein|uniref:Uncharacterized protein n=1 Tax=Marinilabilia salmonicolor TaxID=989 RepID=A0A368V2Q9_9BACT|nr:hypothetical protein DFO77_11171 [Marinilabilia salmonicolor]
MLAGVVVGKFKEYKKHTVRYSVTVCLGSLYNFHFNRSGVGQVVIHRTT